MHKLNFLLTTTNNLVEEIFKVKNCKWQRVKFLFKWGELTGISSGKYEDDFSGCNVVEINPCYRSTYYLHNQDII